MPVTDISLLFMLSLVSTINGLVLAWAALLGAPRKPALLFSVGSFLLAVSPVTLLVTETASSWRAFGLNVPPLLSYLCWLLGTLWFCNLTRLVRPISIATLLLVLLVLWLNFQNEYRDQRIFLVVVGLALLRGGTAWVLARYHGDLDRRVARVFAAVLLIEVAAFSLRGVTVLTGDMPSIGADIASTTTATWLAVLLAAALSTPLLMLLGLGRMITDLRHTGQRLRATLAALPDVVFELDAEARFTALHARALLPNLIRSTDVIGQRADLILPATAATTVHNMMQALAQGGHSLGTQFELSTPDGQRRFEISAAQRPALTAPDAPGYIFIVRDISEQLRVERLKREFVSVVSHELRTPLTSIVGALDLLAASKAGNLQDESRHLLDIARSNSQRLRLLIDDLLDIDRLAAGKMRFDMLVQPLPELLRAATASNETFGSARGIHLQLQEPVPDVPVRVDSQRFAQVLANLLSNAVKFSPTGGEVSVTAACVGERVRIAVRDHGPGVPPAFRDRLFEPFSQADGSDTREQHGSGLGLAIVRGMIEHMGGTVGYQTAEGGGACFCIELPVASNIAR